MEPDGDLDVVSRKKGGSDATFWRQGPIGTWTKVPLPTNGGAIVIPFGAPSICIPLPSAPWHAKQSSL